MSKASTPQSPAAGLSFQMIILLKIASYCHSILHFLQLRTTPATESIEDDLRIPDSLSGSFGDVDDSSSLESLAPSPPESQAKADVENVQSRVDRIVEVVSDYLNKDSPDDQFDTVGHHGLRSTVTRYIETGEQMELIFPAFPFKSCSSKKVLGELPDLGEEILLRRLNALAQEISTHHAAGAVIRIVSDGVVYQELLQRPGYIPYRYSLELRRMISELGLKYVTAVCPFELLDPSSGVSEAKMTEEEYSSRLTDLHAEFNSHEVPGFDLEEALKVDVGTLRTYLGYTKFLEAELEGQACIEMKDGKKVGKIAQTKARKAIAKRMLIAGAKFSDIVSKRYPAAIRISCHAHGNAGPKYAFDMLPGAPRAITPWHNVIMHKADGSFAVEHFQSFDPSTYECVYRHGRPYYLREHEAPLDNVDFVNLWFNGTVEPHSGKTRC